MKDNNTIERYKEYVELHNFLKVNPKSVLFLLSCIKESQYIQQVANLWFKENSPVFSKDNTISKLLDKKLIVLERKEKKTHYYKTPSSVVTKLLLTSLYARYVNTDIMRFEDFEDNKEEIEKFFENELVLKFLDIDFLVDVFDDTKAVQRYGIEYIDFVFLLRLINPICENVETIKSDVTKGDKIIRVVTIIGMTFTSILPDMCFCMRRFFEHLNMIARSNPEEFIKNIKEIEMSVISLDMQIVHKLSKLSYRK